jgi:hypothetical protein
MANIFKDLANTALKTKVAAETAGARLVSGGLKKVAPNNPVSKGIDNTISAVNKGIDRITKRRGGYVKGGSVQPSYKHGDMPKCKHN